MKEKTFSPGMGDSMHNEAVRFVLKVRVVVNPGW